MKDVKDDNNATNAKHNETNENVGETKFVLLTVVRIYQIKQKRRMNTRRNEDWNN